MIEAKVDVHKKLYGPTSGFEWVPEHSFAVTGKHHWTLEEALERGRSGATLGIPYVVRVRYDPVREGGEQMSEVTEPKVPETNGDDEAPVEPQAPESPVDPTDPEKPSTAPAEPADDDAS